MGYQRPRGTQDFLPDYLDKWNYVESVWRKITSRYNFREIVTPMFESTELFCRTAGETSDIVTKEMYTFDDRGGRSITLRPEGTAPVVRAYFENKMYAEMQPVKLFYIMPMFRYERPQAGRFRQHYQYGVECIGVRNPYIDVEVISLFMEFYSELGVLEPIVWLNSLGCSECRVEYKKKLVQFLRESEECLCEECKIRLHKNPLRALDCKNDECRAYLDKAPLLKDNLCPDCSSDFEQVKRLLNLKKINFVIKPMLVRGLDYYNRTVFEIAAKGVSAKEVIAGGGRYDYLLKEIGGVDSSAFGAGAGMERIIQTLEMQNVEIPRQNVLRTAVVSISAQANEQAFLLAEALRAKGLAIELIVDAKKIGKTLALLDSNKYAYVLIMGEDEMRNRSIVLKNLSMRTQQIVSLDDLRKIEVAIAEGKS